jgi:hypothetical protein
MARSQVRPIGNPFGTDGQIPHGFVWTPAGLIRSVATYPVAGHLAGNLGPNPGNPMAASVAALQSAVQRGIPAAVNADSVAVQTAHLAPNPALAALGKIMPGIRGRFTGVRRGE